MIPHNEINTLWASIDDAVSMAAEGQTADGYLLLLAGLHYAEECIEAGESWAEELTEHYRLAVENHCSSYGVRMG